MLAGKKKVFAYKARIVKAEALISQSLRFRLFVRLKTIARRVGAFRQDDARRKRCARKQSAASAVESG